MRALRRLDRITPRRGILWNTHNGARPDGPMKMSEDRVGLRLTGGQRRAADTGRAQQAVRTDPGGLEP
jgi:hypothetical protein